MSSECQTKQTCSEQNTINSDKLAIVVSQIRELAVDAQKLNWLKDKEVLCKQISNACVHNEKLEIKLKVAVQESLALMSSMLPESLSEEKLREEIKKCGEMWDHTLREDDMAYCNVSSKWFPVIALKSYAAL